MKLFGIALICLFVDLIIANLYVTRRVLNDDLERRQALWQCLIIWLLPGFGGALVYAILSDPHERTVASVRRSVDADKGTDVATALVTDLSDVAD